MIVNTTVKAEISPLKVIPLSPHVPCGRKAIRYFGSAPIHRFPTKRGGASPSLPPPFAAQRVSLSSFLFRWRLMVSLSTLPSLFPCFLSRRLTVPRTAVWCSLGSSPVLSGSCVRALRCRLLICWVSFIKCPSSRETCDLVAVISKNRNFICRDDKWQSLKKNWCESSVVFLDVLVLAFATFVEKTMILVNVISFLVGCFLCAIFIVLLRALEVLVYEEISLLLLRGRLCSDLRWKLNAIVSRR